MQQEVLRRHPTAALRVYAIWVDKLFSDARSRWDAAGLTDPRVTHLWDPDNVSGRWFVDHLDAYQGLDWDLYLLFGPDARWDVVPSPLLGSGFTVISRREQLRQGVAVVVASPSTSLPTEPGR